MTSRIATADVPQMVRRYLMESDLNEVGPCTLAELHGVDWETFRRRLQAKGLTWAGLKKEERVRRIRERMELERPFDPAEAADACGFRSTERFLTFFKSAIGRTYADWRMEKQEAAFCGLLSFHEETEGLEHAQ